jgi:16S rRNA (guanine527-N7)-methyltransferase
MQRSSILDILQDSRLSLNTEISVLAASQIQHYMDLLVKWNQKINLTAEKDPDTILKSHIFDSLQYSRVLKPSFRLMDIGSGAGFPGIPLKIIFPELSLVLVESQRKRCSFIQTVVRELGLDFVRTLNVRAEDIPSREEAKYDAVVFRAVSGLEECLKLGLRFMSPEAKLIVKKPPCKGYAQQVLPLTLTDDIAITNYHGVISRLLVYEKCFT